MNRANLKQYKKPLYALLAITGLVLLLLYLQGSLGRSKVAPGNQSPEMGGPITDKIITLTWQEAAEVRSWPGTIRSRTVTQIAPKIAARIEEIKVYPGDKVMQGDIVTRLDDRELQARLGAARSALNAAKAQLVRAKADARRAQSLFEKEAATQETLDAVVAAYQMAQAKVQEAHNTVAEIESLLAETRLRASYDGIVVKRDAEPGDMALPGRAIVTIQQPQRLRVEVDIPEGCARLIQRGDSFKVQIPGFVSELTAEVEEIAPAADPKTHTVLVKAGLLAQNNLQPGAFAWVYQTCRRHKALLIPGQAVIQVGQIESVRLVKEGRVQIRHVRTGKRYGGQIEVLSGLEAGDKVLIETN